MKPATATGEYQFTESKVDGIIRLALGLTRMERTAGSTSSQVFLYFPLGDLQPALQGPSIANGGTRDEDLFVDSRHMSEAGNRLTIDTFIAWSPSPGEFNGHDAARQISESSRSGGPPAADW